MQHSDFDNPVTSEIDPNDPSHVQAYPSLTSGLVWNAEAGYSLSRKAALSFSVGKLNEHSVAGYDNIGNGNFLKLQSTTYHAALNYVIKIRRNRDALHIGTVLAWHKMESNQSYPLDIKSSSLKGGVNIGYMLSVIKKEHWFLGFKINYTWLPDTEIGPYMVEHELENSSGHAEVYTSRFEKTNVRLQTLQFGLTTGWRF